MHYSSNNIKNAWILAWFSFQMRFTRLEKSADIGTWLWGLWSPRVSSSVLFTIQDTTIFIFFQDYISVWTILATFQETTTFTSTFTWILDLRSRKAGSTLGVASGKAVWSCFQCQLNNMQCILMQKLVGYMADNRTRIRFFKIHFIFCSAPPKLSALTFLQERVSWRKQSKVLQHMQKLLSLYFLLWPDSPLKKAKETA